jgi:hypothetical protein
MLLAAVPPTFSQNSARASLKTSKDESQPRSSLANSRDNLIKATEAYQSSLKNLLAMYETEVKREVDRMEKLKGLYADGLISKRELEEGEKALAEAQAKAGEVRLKIGAADKLIAETLVEAEAADAKTPVPLGPPGSRLKTVAYIRYPGFVNWSLSDTAKIESFFMAKFGRHLPITTYGQSELHTSWNFDHHNAIDVGLHPDSVEGQALINYLQSAGIPFMAFRRAIPGSATGPHIHIGKPSQRITH